MARRQLGVLYGEVQGIGTAFRMRHHEPISALKQVRIETIIRSAEDYCRAMAALGFQRQVYEVVIDVCKRESVIVIPGEPDAVEASACAA